ncbi:MAG: cellulase family glycosylhydrolase [Proteiniphilum sp.]|jgi:endoglucanase|nr:cellulase family glycosylhydrolase [Proteiniphilum sp.]
MKRRDFIKTMSVASAITLPGVGNRLVSAPYSLPDTNHSDQSLPLWKGFNLLNKFNPGNQSAFNEKEFEIIADWGFNFVRIPLSYWCWSSEDDWYSVDEKVLKEIDEAVDLARRYNLHINLNFHRVPGYCINNPRPLPTNLFEDEEPLKACQFHWKLFAERYKGIPSSLLSFNLINEAPSVEDEKYDRVARRLISTIREADPARLIIVDGKDVGRTPLMTITDVPNIIQSGRGYDPMLISHFRAAWPGVKALMDFPEDELSWPLKMNGEITDKQSVYRASVAPWRPWVEQGGKVHIGEMGCYNKTPHKIAMAWLEDVFALFGEQGWGWSLWNLQGDFGVLNSGRKDVKYENYKGFLLDREMLELLKRS